MAGLVFGAAELSRISGGDSSANAKRRADRAHFGRDCTELSRAWAPSASSSDQCGLKPSISESGPARPDDGIFRVEMLRDASADRAIRP
jgi:hypothetical protein